MTGDDATAARSRRTLLVFGVVSLVGVVFLSVGVGSVVAQSPADNIESKNGVEAENTTTPEEVDVSTTSVQEGLTEEFNSGGNADIILRMGELEAETPPGITPTGGSVNVVTHMKRNAQSDQSRAIDRINEIDGVEGKNSFWMGNAVQVDVNTSRVDIDELRSIPGVDRIHENYRVEAFSVASPSGTDAAQLAPTSHTTEPYSWALEQINVPDVRREFGSLLKEDETRVAVLDTGIDPNHPDLTVDGWAEFDDDGKKVGSEPNDCGIHGTHVSGTVAGDGSISKDDYGLYGVAPDTVELYHGGVLTDESMGGCFSGSFASIVGGMQWAVDNNADIISMSLGTKDGTFDAYIQPVQQAEKAGSAVIASAGNKGEGASGSPGNVYDSISVGASTRGEYIANFSSGEVIDTDSAWNPDNDSRINDWPDSYTVPSVSAPGRGIYSSVNDGGYEGLQGTSMAAPHVSGASALIMSVDPNGDMTPDELEGLLRNTSRKPADTELDAEFSVDIGGTNSPVNEGDVLRVDYDLTVSNEAETGLVALSIFDQSGNTVKQVADSTYRSIKPGDVAAGTLKWDTTGQADGGYTAAVGVVNATGDIDASAFSSFEIGSGNTNSITTADVSATDFTFSTAQTDTRYGTGIIDPYAAIVKEFVDGNVTETNVQGGTYEAGETVNVTATLDNTGDIQNGFFVQYEVRGPDGVWRDGGAEYGSSAMLNSGDQTEVDIAWEVGDTAPNGEYDSRITAWAEQDYEHRQNSLDTVVIENSFSVSPNSQPTASFTFSPSSPSTSDTVSFDASGSSDPDGSIQSYSWNFGDGTTATGLNTSNLYDSPGTYTVGLTVKDGDGGTDTEKLPVTVQQPDEETEDRRDLGRGEDSDIDRRRDRGRGEGRDGNTRRDRGRSGGR
jgi:subtilisin family serine protease/chitodextrinase